MWIDSVGLPYSAFGATGTQNERPSPKADIGAGPQVRKPDCAKLLACAAVARTGEVIRSCPEVWVEEHAARAKQECREAGESNAFHRKSPRFKIA